MTQLDLIRKLVAKWKSDGHLGLVHPNDATHTILVNATRCGTLARCAKELEAALDPTALSAQPCGCDLGADYTCAVHTA